MSDLVDLFEESIDEELHLARKKRNWLLSDGKIIEFKTPNRHSIGFSLDKKCFKPFNFLAASPPDGIAKMCDGIIVLTDKNKDYIFLIEQKTRHKDQYKKQIKNAYYFCQWLLNLFKEHQNYQNTFYFIGLLYRPLRQTAQKQTTGHQKQNPISKNGIKYFETHEETTHLSQYYA